MLSAKSLQAVYYQVLDIRSVFPDIPILVNKLDIEYPQYQ